MARSEFTVTTSWQLAASAQAVILVKAQGGGTLMFNDTNSDTAAMSIVPDVNDGVERSAAKSTYVKSLGGTGWVLIVDDGL